MKTSHYNSKVTIARFKIRNLLQFAILAVQAYLTVLFAFVSLEPPPGKRLFQTMIILIAGLVIDHLLFLWYCYYSQLQIVKQKRRYEQEKHAIQLQHSDRFLKAMNSSYREFRNGLQVMLLLAERKKYDLLKEYIFSLAESMTRIQSCHTQNPILNMVIFSHKVLAREKKINLVVDSTTPFHGYFFNFHLLTEAVSLVLDRMVENEVNSNSFTRAVFLDIRADGDIYHFNFYISSEAVLIFKQRRRLNYKMTFGLRYQEKALEGFDSIDELVKRLEGQVEYIIKGDTVVHLKIMINKT